MKRMIVFAFLLVCSANLAPGGPTPFVPQQQLLEPGGGGGGGPTIADKKWLNTQAEYLLTIIKILFKGDETTVKQLEDDQATLEPADKVERRILLIESAVEAEAKKGTK